MFDAAHSQGKGLEAGQRIDPPPTGQCVALSLKRGGGGTGNQQQSRKRTGILPKYINGKRAKQHKHRLRFKASQAPSSWTRMNSGISTHTNGRR